MGHADIAAHKAMTEDALFWIAFMSKPMTAAAFMILVDERKANVDDPVEKHLPEFRGQMVVADQAKPDAPLEMPVDPVTIRNILSHTGGMAFRSPPRAKPPHADDRAGSSRESQAILVPKFASGPSGFHPSGGGLVKPW